MAKKKKFPHHALPKPKATRWQRFKKGAMKFGVGASKFGKVVGKELETMGRFVNERQDILGVGFEQPKKKRKKKRRKHK